MSFAEFDRDGLALRYEDVGEGPTVALPAWPRRRRRAGRRGVSGRAGGRRLTLECRGARRVGARTRRDLSIATFTDDVAALAEQVAPGPVVAGGISMGAAIALRLAVRRRDLVTALVLARPAWLFAPAPDNMRPIGWSPICSRKHALPMARDTFERSETARRLAREAPDNLASLRGFFANHDPKTAGGPDRLDRPRRPRRQRSRGANASPCRRW